MVRAPPPCVTQQYHLASMPAWLSSMGISHHNLLPHIPLIHLSTDSSPHPEIVEQSLSSSSQPLHLPGDQRPCLNYVWLYKDCLILIPFRLTQISCLTLTLKCFSSDSDFCPNVGIGPLRQFPHPLRALPVLLICLIFSPSYLVLPSFGCFCIFFSAGQILLSTLSWCSACISVSEGVFMMHPQREMYSMSTFSSAILFSSWLLDFYPSLTHKQFLLHQFI